MHGGLVEPVFSAVLQPMVVHDFAWNSCGTWPALGIVSIAMALPLLSAVREKFSQFGGMALPLLYSTSYLTNAIPPSSLGGGAIVTIIVLSPVTRRSSEDGGPRVASHPLLI